MKRKLKMGDLIFYLAGEGICLVVGILYQLTPLWIIMMGAMLLIFLMIWKRNRRKGSMEQKRLSDAQIYMEQLLYAFLRQGKVLSAITDVLVLFPEGEMHEVLTQAVAKIRYDYEEKDTTQEAMALIEEKYHNERLATIHRFLYKVEMIGGNYEGITALLLQDLNGWRQRMDVYQKKCRRERYHIGIAIGTALTICMITTYLLPKQVDISGNTLRMASTVILTGILLIIYTKADKRLTVNWLEEGQMEKEDLLAEKYREYLEYEEKRELKKSLFLALFPLGGVLLAALLKRSIGVIVCMFLLLFCLYQHKIGHFLAKRKLSREIEKAFPHWLMELSLLLQTDNVQVSISRTFSHAPKVLLPALKELIEKLDREPEAAEPYLGFLKEFSNPQIQAAMKMLYAISVGNGGNEKEQLQELIARNQNLMNQAEEMAHEDALAGMYALFLTPSLAGGAKLLVDMTIFMLAFFQQAAVG